MKSVIPGQDARGHYTTCIWGEISPEHQTEKKAAVRSRMKTISWFLQQEKHVSTSVQMKQIKANRPTFIYNLFEQNQQWECCMTAVF